MLLSDKYPFLTNYFETCIKSDSANLSHSILLYGNDLESQYTLALEIARVLNCKEGGDDNCECVNCKWIREGSHPAVLTISRKDNKPDDDSSKTVISVAQSKMIRDNMMVTSDFYRVFILCDKDNDDNIMGLNRKNLPEATANSLLKSIEEPTEKVVFIFLTQDKDDVISTIVSRSQCFFVPTHLRLDTKYDDIKNVFENYWEIKRGEAFDVAERLVALSNNISIKKVLEQMQNYMLLMLKQNPKMSFLIDDIKSVELAKKEAELGMKSDTVFDELCLTLIR